MADDDLVEVVACNFEQGWMLRGDGVKGAIIQMMDIYGDETDDLDDAVVLVVEWADERMSAIEIEPGHKAVLQ